MIINNDLQVFTMAVRDKKFQFRAQNFRLISFQRTKFKLNSFQSTKFQTEFISEHKISD